jgi:tetratricopeptide (TPR) repeat protein
MRAFSSSNAPAVLHLKVVVIIVAVLCAPLLAAQEQEELPISFPIPQGEGGIESRLLEIGRRAFLENRQDEAYQAFTELLRINPNHVEALYRLAIVNFQNKNYAEGIVNIQRAVELDPDNPMPRLAYAKALEEIGRIDEAVNEYQYVLSRMGQPPDSPAAARADRSLSLLLLTQAEKQRDRDAVLERGSAIRGKYPTDASLLHTVGSTFVRAGLLSEAEQTYQALVALMPNSPLAYFHLGNVYEVMRDMDRAEGNYLQAQQKGAREDLARQVSIKLGTIRGLRLLQRGDHELARQAFVEVQELDPLNVIANSNIARLSLSAGKFEVAAEAFTRLLKVDPGNLEAHYRLGLIHLDAKRLLDAIPELDYVLAHDRAGKMTAMVNELYGRVDQQLGGRLQDVRRLLVEKDAFIARLARNPNDAEANLGLGEILQHQSKLPEAKERFKKAVESDPLLGIGYVRLGEMAERENDLPTAIDNYQKALAALIDDDEKVLEIQKRLMMTIGSHHFKEGRLEQAEQAFTDVLTKFGADKSVLWNLALVTSRQGNNAVAKDYYYRLLEMDPSYMAARFNLGLMFEQEEDEELALVEYRKVLLSGTDDQRLLKVVAERIKQVQRSINGIGYQVGYAVGMDDNASIGYSDKLFEYRTQTSVNLSYNYKIKKGMRFSFRLSPDYGVYHVGGADFFSLSMTPSLAVKWNKRQWSLGLNRATQSSVLRAEQSSTTTDTLFGSVGWQGADSVGYQANFSYRGFGSLLNPFFDAETYTFGISGNQMGEHGLPLSYGYSLTINQNTKRQGNDYAYVSHGVNGRVDKSLGEGWSSYLSSNMNLYLYSNPDSYTQFQKKRVNLSLGLGGGINYRYSSGLSFYAGYDYYIQRSNLPFGYIYNQLQVIEGVQSASLGSYARNSINFGARYNF